MSIILHSSSVHEGDEDGAARCRYCFGSVKIGEACFYCYKPINPPAVQWMGANGMLVLHAACVIELFLRLGRDVWEIECKTGEYIATNPLFQYRTRLIAEEMGQEPTEGEAFS